MRRVPAQGELPLKRARALPIDDPALTVDVEAFTGYTKWHEEGGAPPFSGYWDLKVRGDFKPSTATHRVWFDKDKDVWHVGEVLIPSGTVLADFVWRGLIAPWPMGYTYRVPGLRVVPLEN